MQRGDQVGTRVAGVVGTGYAVQTSVSCSARRTYGGGGAAPA